MCRSTGAADCPPSPPSPQSGSAGAPTLRSPLLLLSSQPGLGLAAPSRFSRAGAVALQDQARSCGALRCAATIDPRCTAVHAGAQACTQPHGCSPAPWCPDPYPLSCSACARQLSQGAGIGVPAAKHAIRWHAVEGSRSPTSRFSNSLTRGSCRSSSLGRTRRCPLLRLGWTGSPSLNCLYCGLPMPGVW